MPLQFVVLHIGGHIDGFSVLGIEHHLFEKCVLGILLRQGEVDDALVRLVGLESLVTIHSTPDTVAVNGLFHEDGAAGALLEWHPRPAERPARSCGHVQFHAVLLALLLGIAQHFHPLVREVRDIVGLVALHAIERCNLHGTHAMLGIFLQVPLQVLLVYCRA